MLARILLSLVMFAMPVQAGAFCFQTAGAEYGVSPDLLQAIAWVESSYNPGAVNRNSNGSYDFGLMQINSSWAKTLGKDLWAELGDPCVNVKVGAWILADCFARYGQTAEGVGCYNATSSAKRIQYARKIFRYYSRVDLKQ